MISRAINSGRNHGIDLVPGRPNPGLGDYAFEAIIQNNNDRSCFQEKFLLPVNHYRGIWTTDMANRTIDGPWNTYSRNDWLEGWRQMQIPGTYERGIFGDLMLPGIACGIRKILLIFNTNENSPHDPIYIVNPELFNVRPDSIVPIVLAYNLSHYESLHQSTDYDIQATINLIIDYQEGRYQFKREDLPMLLSIEKIRDHNSTMKSPAKKEREDDDFQECNQNNHERERVISNTSHISIDKLSYRLKNT